jgi:hypothetical protein
MEKRYNAQLDQKTWQQSIALSSTVNLFHNCHFRTEIDSHDQQLMLRILGFFPCSMNFVIQNAPVNALSSVVWISIL